MLCNVTEWSGVMSAWNSYDQVAAAATEMQHSTVQSTHNYISDFHLIHAFYSSHILQYQATRALTC